MPHWYYILDYIAIVLLLGAWLYVFIRLCKGKQ